MTRYTARRIEKIIQEALATTWKLCDPNCEGRCYRCPQSEMDHRLRRIGELVRKQAIKKEVSHE